MRELPTFPQVGNSQLLHYQFFIMISPPAIPADQLPLWRTMVMGRCGLYFSDQRVYFLRRRLWERMCLLGIESYDGYYHHLLHNVNGEAEWMVLQDSLVNNETSFFRHKASFEALQNVVLPALFTEKRQAGTPSIHMWSAGCSAGQEAYSLAMLLHGALDSHLWQTSVLGTDISRRKLGQAKRGVYHDFELKEMPALYRTRYLQPLSDNKHSIHPDLRPTMQWQELNFFNSDHYPVPQQDVIFCQNVLIYFQAGDRHWVVERLCRHLNPGGYLFLAPAELIGVQLTDMQLVRLPNILLYQKKRN